MTFLRGKILAKRETFSIFNIIEIVGLTIEIYTEMFEESSFKILIISFLH
jgi:hypothetical protein